MRDTFRAYYPPTPTDMAQLWAEGLLILDTNALLNLFRYSERAREDFLKVLAAKADDLWLPHQVGMEFHRRRIEIINEQGSAFGEIEKALDKARGQVDNAFNTYKRHPSLDISPLQTEFGTAVTAIIAKLHAAREEHRASMVASNTNEKIFAQITYLYDGRVGPAFSEEELAKVHQEGATRYDNQIPPGYKDANKGEPGKYGDLVLWKQTLAQVGTAKRSAIFVTNDQKEDWWYIIDSERHGGRPELIEEYYAASGQRVHFMTTDRFLDFATTQVNDISTESVTELESIARESAKSEKAREARNATLTAADWVRRADHPRYGNVATGTMPHDNEPIAQATTMLAKVSQMISALNEETKHVHSRILHEGPSPELEERVVQLDHQMAAARRLERYADRELDRAIEEARADGSIRLQRRSDNPGTDAAAPESFLEYFHRQSGLDSGA